MHKKIGRPALKNSPLSNKEKKLRYNTRAAIKLKVAESRGFVPITSLISKVHLLAMTEAYEFKLDDDDINIFIFKALKAYLESLDIRTPKSKLWLQSHDELSLISVESMMKFLEWEQSQLTGEIE